MLLQINLREDLDLINSIKVKFHFKSYSSLGDSEWSYVRLQ